ncbi:hypothetical protein BOTBODRAFT_31031 [Botryobasidium botryosum FD-172 SS1]|uniref:Uncharacterized protein n=1 Tax=Botryobasidium botryosum (strain FD-172 SS1) TaxID=930990 RepID=A0A067MXV8_BOTB1|nr:hypothetical protein BOTBODRAFT_31031 [Botryobasidium botryosum FD-172 SS1]
MIVGCWTVLAVTRESSRSEKSDAKNAEGAARCRQLRTHHHTPPSSTLLNPMARFTYQPQPHFAGYTLAGVRRFVPTLGVWGLGAGAAVTLLLSSTPLFKKDVLLKVPLLSNYFEDKTPASDKPF